MKLLQVREMQHVDQRQLIVVDIQHLHIIDIALLNLSYQIQTTSHLGSKSRIKHRCLEIQRHGLQLQLHVIDRSDSPLTIDVNRLREIDILSDHRVHLPVRQIIHFFHCPEFFRGIPFLEIPHLERNQIIRPRLKQYKQFLACHLIRLSHHLREQRQFFRSIRERTHVHRSSDRLADNLTVFLLDSFHATRILVVFQTRNHEVPRVFIDHLGIGRRIIRPFHQDRRPPRV